jgi:hypothetical protein
VQHPSEDDLALLALGEPVPGVADHVEQCPVCDGEVSALRATVATARSSDMLELTAPPPAVWQRIAGELGIGDAGPVARPDDVVVPLRRSPWRGPLTAAAGLARCRRGGGRRRRRGPVPRLPRPSGRRCRSSR